MMYSLNNIKNIVLTFYTDVVNIIVDELTIFEKKMKKI